MVEPTQPLKLGTENIKALLAFAFAFGRALEKSLEDGKFQLDDIGNFLPAFMAGGEAFKDVKQAIAEIKDLEPGEIQELHSYIVGEFDLANDAIEAFIEDGLGLVINAYNLVKIYLKAQNKCPRVAKKRT